MAAAVTWLGVRGRGRSDAGRRDRSGEGGGGEGEAMAGAESMPSIKQEALCCLKSARSLGEFIVNPSSWGADGGRRRGVREGVEEEAK